jgi:hypothetical protein
VKSASRVELVETWKNERKTDRKSFNGDTNIITEKEAILMALGISIYLRSSFWQG